MDKEFIPYEQALELFCILYDINDIIIQKFDSIKQCSEFIGCSSVLVRNASNGKVKLIHKKYKIKRND